MDAHNSESIQETVNDGNEEFRQSEGVTNTRMKRASNQEESNDDSTKVVKKSRESSEVWNYFVRFLEDGRTRARCKECGASYAISSSSHGITNLKSHLAACPERNTDARQLHLAHDIKLRAKKIKPEIYRVKLAIAIIKHNYPFSIAEHEGLRDVLTYLNDDIKSYTRNTIKVDCWKLYNKEKEKLASTLSKVPGRISITSNCWTSCTTESYICLTAHFVDEKWKLHTKILNMHHFPRPHTEALMAKVVFDMLKEWGFERKIFSLKLDNASNCDKMEEVLPDQMNRQNFLLCKGCFPCAMLCTYLEYNCAARAESYKWCIE